MAASPRIGVEKIGDIAVVRFTTRKLLDEDTIGAISDRFLQLIDGSPGRMLVTFENVDYLSSSMLRLLVKVQERIDAAGGRLVLCNMSPDIRELFNVTTLDRVFEICEWNKADDPDASLGGIWSRPNPPRPSR